MDRRRGRSWTFSAQLKLVATFTIVLLATSIASATEQVRDRLEINGRTYAIEQQPMLGLWHSVDLKSGGEKPMPKFSVTSSANWRGYVATFSIANDKLYLLEIEAEVGSKPKTGRELIGKRLPTVARWFSGSIFVPVGDYDQDAGASRYVIEFVIDKGLITDTRFFSSLKLPYTWNGRPDSKPAGTRPSREKVPVRPRKQQTVVE